MKRQQISVTVFAMLLFVITAVIIGPVFWRRSSNWRDPARYSRAFNDLESPSPTARKRALHELLDPVDYPLPDVKRQTRLAIDMLLGDEDESVRQTAALKLSSVAGRIRHEDPDGYRRIMVAISRSMAEDASARCRYAAAYALESDVVGRHLMDQSTAKLCKPYWEKATHDGDKDVAQLAKSYLLSTHLSNK